jgi:hypothetical protein
MFPTTAIVLLTGSLALCAPQGETTGQAGTTRPGLPAALRLEVGLGYDLFTHSYRVLSADTSTTLSEGSSMLNVVWSPWRDLGRQLELGNRFYASREYLHNVVSGYWSSIAGGLAWAADARWEAKRFQDGTLTYANDHDALQAALRGSWRWDRRWGVRGSLQADSFTYDRRSEFFYDTRTWSAEAAFGGGGWFGPWWELDGRGGAQAAPDTSVLDHTDREARLRAGWVFDDAGEVSAELTWSRRDYPTGGPRPDRAAFGVELYGRLRPLERWGGWFDLYLDRATYSVQTLVYNDARELRLAAGPAWHPSTATEVRLGLGVADRTSGGFSDTTYVDIFGVTRIVDAWTQPFLFLETTLYTSGGLWLMATLEGGRRRYGSSTEWDSDYYYLDLGGSAEIPLPGGLALQLMTNFTPEQHREPEDNRVTNYTSVDLIWRFR